MPIADCLTLGLSRTRERYAVAQDCPTAQLDDLGEDNRRPPPLRTSPDAQSFGEPHLHEDFQVVR